LKVKVESHPYTLILSRPERKCKAGETQEDYTPELMENAGNSVGIEGIHCLFMTAGDDRIDRICGL
jgi:hypothetical protein